MHVKQENEEQIIIYKKQNILERMEKYKELTKGVALTLVLAILSGQLAKLPFFSIMGIMIISIMIGMAWKGVMGVQADASVGITFSSKFLLRVGIILMGLKLNLAQIASAGPSVILIDAIVIAFTLTVMIGLGKIFNINKHLAVLLAVGTAVCGAAAIVAVAPLINGKKEYTGLAVACIATLGTFGAIGYIFFYPLLDMDPYRFGVLVGATLHEVAHVIAAAVPGGAVAMESAILVKLGRVALLIPITMIIGFVFSKKTSTKTERKRLKELPIPWFIFGFLGMSIVNTFDWLPPSLINMLIVTSVFLLSMAMAGLGLSINFSDFKKVGFRPILVGILGFLVLASLGPFLLYLL